MHEIGATLSDICSGRPVLDGPCTGGTRGS